MSFFTPFAYIQQPTPGFPSVIDPDAQAFLNATGITNQTIVDAINTLVVDLKTNNIWDDMLAIYPMVGGTATTNKYNLKDPQDTNGAFRLNFVGGWTHNSSGSKPDGVAGTYADTFLNASSSLTPSTGSFSYYSFTDSPGDIVEIGVNDNAAATNESLLALRYSGAQFGFYSQLGGSGGAVADSKGFGIVNRTTNVELWRDGTRVLNQAGSVASMPNRTFYLGAQNNGTNSYRNSNRGCSFSHIGYTLSSPSTFTTIVNTFQTSLSRNTF
jgi:hypothetical protein